MAGPPRVSVRLPGAPAGLEAGLAESTDDPFRKPVVGYGGSVMELNMGGRVAAFEVVESVCPAPAVVVGIDIVLRGGGRNTCSVPFVDGDSAVDCANVVEGLWSPGCVAAGEPLGLSSRVVKMGLGVGPSSSFCAVTELAEVEISL